MGREHAPFPGGGERVVERLAGGDRLGGELERRECGVAFVEMQDAGIDPERAEHSHRADPEEAVLAEPRVRVPLVEARRDPPVDRVVLVELRVEEVQRHAPDLGAPYVECDLAAEQRERQPQRPPGLVEHLDGREPLRERLQPVLVLEARAVDPLLEVPPPVQQADADHRQPAVARRLEDVPGEDAEAARIDRQRPVDPELRADEHDRPVEAVDPRLWTGAIFLEDAGEPGDALPGGGVGDRARRHVRRDVGELADRVRQVDLPAVRVERAEQLLPVGIPRPAVVERDPCERHQLIGKTQGELGGSLVRFPRARERREVDESGRAHDRAR